MIALVEAAKSLVALENVFERAAQAVCTPSVLLAVTGPSMKLQTEPPRLRLRSWAKMPRSSHHARILLLDSGMVWNG